MRLGDKVALITGSSRGIGRVLAIGLAREGAKVVVNYHKTKQRAEETVKEIREGGGEAFSVRADVSNAAEVERMVSLASRKVWLH